MMKDQMVNLRVVVVVQFFENVWGKSVFVQRVLLLFIGFFLLGNVFVQLFVMFCVKQELVKEGVLLWLWFWVSDWLFNVLFGVIFFYWIVIIVFIFVLQMLDVYIFVINVFVYSLNWIKIFFVVGLVYLNFMFLECWVEQRIIFWSLFLLMIFWMVLLLFVQVVMFILNQVFMMERLLYYVVFMLGMSLLVIGMVYWLIWVKVLFVFGYYIQYEIVQMFDGSERVKYKVSCLRLDCLRSEYELIVIIESQIKKEEKKIRLMVMFEEVVGVVIY